MDIDYIYGRFTKDIFGISKYSDEINRRLTAINFHPIGYPAIGRSVLMDGAVKRLIYPFIVRNSVKNESIRHVARQDLAFLLTLMNLHPVIVTCYDLIPWAYYKNRSLTWRMNMSGLRKADYIVTISRFSKDEIVRHAGVPEERIIVVPPGVDTTHYYRRDSPMVRDIHSIPERCRIILYVGSEEPRKNLEVLLKALSVLKKKFPDFVLLKVGAPQMGGERGNTIRLVRSMGLDRHVIFTGAVPEEILPFYYSAADILVFPSLYEGFGMPPLEAMACGCPVVASNIPPVLEAVGDAGVLFNPVDDRRLSEHIHNFLTGDEPAEHYGRLGKERSRLFGWEKSAEMMQKLYEMVSSGRVWS